jgi:uroporphyrinogen-III decarboxylase
MPDTMTPRERWLAAIRMQPVDRLPFWPKLDGAYPRAQAAPFRDMNPEAIHDWIGSDKHIGIAGVVKEMRQASTVETSQRNGSMRTVYRTPHGTMEGVQQFDEASQAWHPTEFPVKTVDDVRLMAEVYDDVTVELDPEGLEAAQKEQKRIGQDAVTASGIGKSPLMLCVEWLAGVEMAHYLLLEHQDDVEALFAAMHRVLLRVAEIAVEHSPADLLYMVENTSTTLISPAQFKQYCFEHISAYGSIARQAKRNLVLHMCGHLKALLPDLAKVPARAFEAFTSPTLGNTTLLDGRAQCPNTCLIGGTNAMLWTKPANDIIGRIESDLDALPHHQGIVVTSAGVMPPMCKPETIKAVCDWVKLYPPRS